MPFVTIPFSRGPQVIEPYVAVSVNKSTAHRSLAIYVSHPLCAFMGWTHEDRVSIMEGIEDDAGIMMIERNPAGHKLYKANEGHSLSSRVSASRLRNYIIDYETATYTVAEHTADKTAGVLVKLPEWMRYTGPPAKPKLAMVPPPNMRRK